MHHDLYIVIMIACAYVVIGCITYIAITFVPWLNKRFNTAEMVFIVSAFWLPAFFNSLVSIIVYLAQKSFKAFKQFCMYIEENI